MKPAARRVLLLGYGNPGRLDDGLGPALADIVARQGLDGVTVDSDYQLQVENAALIADHDVVVFADATVAGDRPYTFERVKPAADASFTTHSVSAPALLALAHDHFESRAEGYMLAIRGQDFDGFGERFSEQATANLAVAARFILERLHERRFDEVRAGTHADELSCVTSA